jgi:hypothetical protein
MLIVAMDGSLVWSNRHHQSGTMMPLGAVHPIIASEAKQSSSITVESGLLRRPLGLLAMTEPIQFKRNMR